MVELTDGTVALRPWRVEEAGWYAEQVKDARIQQNTSERSDLTAREVAEAIIRHADDPAHRGWAVCSAATGELLGNAALNLASGDISYWVAAAARGRGVATAAVRLMVAYAFETAHLDRLRLHVRAGNHASAHVALATGFTRAPDLDADIEVNGEPWRTEHYTLSRPAVSRAHP